MLVIKVELYSAVTGQITEIARAVISNDASSETDKHGNYDCATMHGRRASNLRTSMYDWLIFLKNRDGSSKPNGINRHGRVTRYPRQDLHVWHLVARALYAMGYGSKKALKDWGDDPS